MFQGAQADRGLCFGPRPVVTGSHDLGVWILENLSLPYLIIKNILISRFGFPGLLPEAFERYLIRNIIEYTHKSSVDLLVYALNLLIYIQQGIYS